MIKLNKDWSIRRDSNCFTLIKRIVPTEPNEDGVIAPPRDEPKGYFTSLSNCLNHIAKLEILGKKDARTLEDLISQVKDLCVIFEKISAKVEKDPKAFNEALISSKEVLDISEEE